MWANSKECLDAFNLELKSKPKSIISGILYIKKQRRVKSIILIN